VSEREGFQHGVPCWVDTWQADADAAVTFYRELFGWEAEDTMPEDFSGRHYMCRLRGRDVAAVASRPEGAPDVTAWTTYVWVEDVDRTVAKVIEAEGSVLKEPFEALDGGRIAIVADPAGAALGIWQPGAHKGAQLVNEPSAWAMSGLSTDDPEGAKRFYRNVFGWDTATFDAGGAEITMWTVPGYLGGEPQQPVPRDVVATMVPASADGEGPPPSWSVDFWIADVDRATAKVAELGGRVITQPYDIPNTGLRQGVFADPEGATFSLTRPPGLPASG
jgi:predicted enzyme related to lactoylglutathione lyase